MKTVLAVALLALSTSVLAQSNSGTIDRTTPQAATDVSPEEISKIEPGYRALDGSVAPTVISRNPKDMDDTTGMEEQTVITWVDRNGVRSYTDNPKLAPRNAKTRQVYSMPPATQYIPAEILVEDTDVDLQD